MSYIILETGKARKARGGGVHPGKGGGRISHFSDYSAQDIYACMARHTYSTSEQPRGGENFCLMVALAARAVSGCAAQHPMLPSDYLALDAAAGLPDGTCEGVVRRWNRLPEAQLEQICDFLEVTDETRLAWRGAHMIKKSCIPM